MSFLYSLIIFLRLGLSVTATKIDCLHYIFGVIKLTHGKKKSLCFKNLKGYRNKNYYNSVDACVDIISISKISRGVSIFVDNF